MVFEKKGFAQLFEAMQSRTPDTLTDFQEGSVVRTLYESFAWELALLYEQMQRVYLSGFVDTAEGIDLDKVVAILGIKRGEPDYATGKVTFTRDIGIDEDIFIPKGTLVTTEDTQESPKKAYETIEEGKISKDQTTAQVRVQALRRGKTEETEAETIVVMPQPVVGVKSVNNQETLRFTGKLQESDEQLRQRAKQTLLATSGGNTTSIRNALLSLPGVREVQVRENFHFAKGKVKVTKSGSLSEELKVPKGTTIKLEILGTQTKDYHTTQEVILSAGENQEVEVEVEAGISGAAGEAQASATWQDLEVDSVTLTVSNEQAISRQDFGIIEIFVDGIDFRDLEKVSQLKQEIDRVKAAGIYPLLKPATAVNVDGVFQIELQPGLKLSPEERLQLEEKVQQTIISHLKDQKMGQPLLISQLTRKILGCNGVNDLVDFTLTTSIRHSKGIELARQHYQSSERPVKRLEVDILEKFTPHSVRVASEIKPLSVALQIKAQALDDQKQQAIEQALQNYFADFKPSQAVVRSEIKARIETITTIEAIKLIPFFWQPGIPLYDDTVNVTFVEQAQLSSVFLYERLLTITGALKLILPVTVTQQEKQQIYQQVREQVSAYLEQLQPEENIQLEQLVEQAKTVESVLDINWKLEDFHVLDEDNNAKDIIDQEQSQIQVNKFEKTQLADADNKFIITSDIQVVDVAIATLNLRLTPAVAVPETVDP
ncbi:baseplate J/gp47 family protein, partial [Moorena sp. SIO3B2]|uniref:baseplate J/gp47 family protein n=1 Tax=Moorena sp. SIO3B2 TaxID=2607827 RepID=UPI0013CB0716